MNTKESNTVAVDLSQRHGIRSPGSVSDHQQRSGVEASSASTSAAPLNSTGVAVYTEEERYLAVRGLHYRSPEGVPGDPPDVARARKALSGLVAAHKGDPHWSRDTRRAAKLYQRKLDEHADRLVDLAVSKGLLPTPKGN